MPADDYDALLRKYDLNGALLGNRQFGTASFDYGNAVAAGGSRVFVAGHTGGSLAGGPGPAGGGADGRGGGIFRSLPLDPRIRSPHFQTALRVPNQGPWFLVVRRYEGNV